MNIIIKNIDKVRFIIEEIIHLLESDYSIDSFKTLFMSSKFLLGKRIDFYEGINNSLKKLISYDDIYDNYNRNIVLWLNKPIKFQMDLVQDFKEEVQN